MMRKILGRQKWKFALPISAALAISVLAFMLTPSFYVSEAKLLFRYPLESWRVSATGGLERAPAPSSARSRLGSEVEIIKSMDVALEAARSIGVTNLLGPTSTVTNDFIGAGVIVNGLTVEVPARTDVLRIRFRHPDAKTSQRVVEEVVKAYRARHVEVHLGAPGTEDVFMRHRDETKEEMARLADDLKAAVSALGFPSLEGARDAQTKESYRAREALFSTETALAEKMAVLRARERLQPREPEPGASVPDLTADAAAVSAQEARLAVVRKQLKGLEENRLALLDGETRILDLQRRRAMAEQRYIDLTLQLGILSQQRETSKAGALNIAVVQTASRSTLEPRHLGRTTARLLALGFLIGLGLAALSELALFFGGKKRVEPAAEQGPAASQSP